MLATIANLLAVALVATQAQGDAADVMNRVATVDVRFVFENNTRCAEYLKYLEMERSSLRECRARVEKEMATLCSGLYPAQDLWTHWGHLQRVFSLQDEYFKLARAHRERANLLVDCYSAVIRAIHEVCKEIQATQPGTRIIYTNLAFPFAGMEYAVWLKQQLPPFSQDITQHVLEHVNERGMPPNKD